MPLPLKYQERLNALDNVVSATHMVWFGGVYKDERNFFPQMAIDPPSFRTVFREFVFKEDEWKNFVADRQGVIVGRTTAERFNLKVGDRVPLLGTIFPGTWEFNVRAIYDGSRPQDDLTNMWFHYDYLDERRPSGKGLTGWYTARLANIDQAVETAEEIDALFANSPWETRTQTEKAFMTSFANQMGNIGLLLVSIGAVVFFTLLLVTGNTMAMAVRERTPELAVLKAVGYSDQHVLWLTLVESVLIATAGGLVGLACAKALTLGGDPTGGMLPVFHLPDGAVVVGIAMSVCVGFIAGLLPAISAMRLRVVDALRRL
jgi:putative ABC transport system permease protein